MLTLQSLRHAAPDDRFVEFKNVTDDAVKYGYVADSVSLVRSVQISAQVEVAVIYKEY